MLLSDMRTEVTSMIGLTNTVAGDQTLVDQWINEGVADVLLKTNCKALPGTVTMTAGSADYTLSTSILSILDCWMDSDTNTRLERSTPSDILTLRVTSGDATPPVMFYAVAGSNLLMVHPTPTSADVLNLLYVPRPATLASASDTPSEIPSEFHRAVVFFALWRAGDYDDDESSDQGERYRAKYLEVLREMRIAMRKKGGHRLAPARVNPRRRGAMVSHDRSTY